MEPVVERCPPWCVSGSDAPSGHAHVSADVIGGAAEQPLVARLIRMRQDEGVRVLLNDRVASLDDVGRFLGSLRCLLDEAVIAEPGLGFVGHLAAQADITLADMARATGIGLGALEAQRDGLAVLTVKEFDRLALAVAKLVSTAVSRPA